MFIFMFILIMLLTVSNLIGRAFKTQSHNKLWKNIYHYNFQKMKALYIIMAKIMVVIVFIFVRENTILLFCAYCWFHINTMRIGKYKHLISV